MNNISNIHKSFTFNVFAIVSTFIGIIFTIQYSKSENHYDIPKSFRELLDVPKTIYLQNDHSHRRKDKDTVSLDYNKYPIDSVPVKVVLGKIKKIDNPYLPKLHIAFFAVDKKYISIK